MEPLASQPLTASTPRHRVPGWLWLTAGVVVGLGIAALWPQRPLAAATSDRNEKFGMCTVYVAENLEAVFVLDFLTGRLTGACLGKQSNAGFVQFFAADVASDLQVKGAKPAYAMTPGLAQIRSRPGVQPAASVIYVAEMTTGKVGCYAIPFLLPNSKNPVPAKLAPLDVYTFRDAAPAE
ncbi:MAG: hypothetical protein FD138_2765 [Planctomycetota bacterium]|nr:MAG: hypothetical protein FD138_2765 [Planctomycetota bacterium]